MDQGEKGRTKIEREVVEVLSNPPGNVGIRAVCQRPTFCEMGLLAENGFRTRQLKACTVQVELESPEAKRITADA